MPRTGLYIQLAALAPDASGRYSQDDVSQMLEKECRIGQALGQGSFGAAFLVEHAPSGANKWVVKLPRAMLAGENMEGRFLAEAVNRKATPKNRQAALKDFETECRNAEAILDPPYLHQLRPTAGARLVGLTLEQKTRLEADTLEWRARAGYAHLHPLLHYDPAVPMLISARAEGTLSSRRRPDAFRLPGADEWARVAEHLTAAVAFILDNTPLAHMDIKPDNIFVVYDAAQRFVYRLGDYGICRPQADRVVYFWNQKHTSQEIAGSPFYNPPSHPETLMTYQQASCFQCFATLLATVYLPTDGFFLDDRPGLYSVHTAALQTKGELHTLWQKAAPDALLRIVVDALREPNPAEWPRRFKALRVRFASTARASSAGGP